MENHELKLSIESTIKTIELPVKFKPPPAPFTTTDTIMVIHKLAEIVSITAKALDISVYDQGKCVVYKYKVQDQLGMIMLTSFTELKVRSTKSYHFLDVTVNSFKND